jgi:hypothetical protein
MTRTLRSGALLLLAACGSAPPRTPTAPEEHRVHAAPRSRPTFAGENRTGFNAVEWQIERERWIEAAALMADLLLDPKALVPYPSGERRWIPAWRYASERAPTLPAEFRIALAQALRRDGPVIPPLLLDPDQIESLVNQRLQEGRRWDAALLCRLYPSAEPLVALKGDWAIGRAVSSQPGLLIGDGPGIHRHPVTCEVTLTTPSGSAEPLPGDHPGWEHSHALGSGLVARFTRDGAEEPFILSLVTPDGELPICAWTRDVPPREQDLDIYLGSPRACAPIALPSFDRVFLVGGGGFVASLRPDDLSIDWILEYPRDGVWRDGASARLDAGELAVLPPDSSLPLLIDVVQGSFSPPGTGRR